MILIVQFKFWSWALGPSMRQGSTPRRGSPTCWAASPRQRGATTRMTRASGWWWGRSDKAASSPLYLVTSTTNPAQPLTLRWSLFNVTTWPALSSCSAPQSPAASWPWPALTLVLRQRELFSSYLPPIIGSNALLPPKPRAGIRMGSKSYWMMVKMTYLLSVMLQNISWTVAVNCPFFFEQWLTVNPSTIVFQTWWHNMITECFFTTCPTSPASSIWPDKIWCQLGFGVKAGTTTQQFGEIFHQKFWLAPNSHCSPSLSSGLHLTR